MHRYFLLIFFNLPFFLFGQQVDPKKHVLEVSGEKLNSGRVDTEFISTAIAIKANTSYGSFISVAIGGATFQVPLDPDASEYTYFLSHGQSGPIEILVDDPAGLQVFLINSGTVPEINTTLRTDAENECIDSFYSVPQSEWRAGLTSPNYTRIETNVEHVVIHHSAGSNTNTNFVQVVRDIYVYHTEVNGWSDIGYNYVIAQDGTIFNGRDPGSLEQDNVLGAHFCGSNSTTMGICLLGNYETADLSSESSMSLVTVVAWKLDKEGLTPYTTHQHALGIFDAVIGHRDGCSTLCPGENVYNNLEEIKLGVENIQECGSSGEPTLAFRSNTQLIDARSTVTFTNLSDGYDTYEWIFDGGIPSQAEWDDSGVVNYNYPGVFNVSLIGTLVDRIDTLRREAHIEVEGDLVVFPNPVITIDELSIQHNKEILGAELFDMEGQEFDLLAIENGKYKLPILDPGVYLLKIKTVEAVIGRKIIIQ